MYLFIPSIYFIPVRFRLGVDRSGKLPASWPVFLLLMIKMYTIMKRLTMKTLIAMIEKGKIPFFIVLFWVLFWAGFILLDYML